jgi:endonuclease/exonuclease/phosphatase (EEP) superfamily protein YafD
VRPAEHIQAYPRTEFSVREELHVVTWNLGKQVVGSIGPQLEQLCTAKHCSLIALQEVRAKLQLPKEYGAHFGESFRMRPFGDAHGVMTLGSVMPSEALVLQAPHRELHVATPKVALTTLHPVSDGSQLLALNVHALNFDRKGHRFVAQIEELGARLDQHDGPVLFCGDFNTWHPKRLGHLRQVADTHGLAEVQSEPGGGRTGGATRLGNLLFGIDPQLQLDRIFYRGLRLIDQRWLPELDASDHVPLHARFAF